MLFRSSAAICGAVVALAISVTIARSEVGAVHSSAVVNAASGDAIVGAASTYNPFRPGWREGGPNTASGERYDPSVWAAAIKTSLRQKFGGVQYGERPKYALVEAVGKKVIVKINDVGPLTPGRIKRQTSTNWRSISRPPRHSGSRCRQRCSPAPMK